jgi:hypothetical protein
LRRNIIVALLSVTVALATTTSAFAHDCFNPNKTPGAGSKTTVVLAPNPDDDPTAVITTGKGNGGFTTLDATAVGIPGVTTIDVHTFGNQKGPKDGEVGPGAEKAGAKGCDGKGVDYIEACFGAG